MSDNLFNDIDDSSSLIEQYKLFVESSEKVSSSRHTANNIYITINSILIGLIGFLITNGGSFNVIYYLIIIFGLVICTIRFLQISSYKKLNSTKFSIIHQLEHKLPANLYSYEWQKLGEGEDKKLYFPISKLEMTIPIVFGLFYLAYLIYLLAPHINCS